MSQLRPFSLSVRVEAREAKQDWIALDLGDWFVQDIGNGIGAFVDMLGPPMDAGEITEANASRWANILTTFPVATIEREFFGRMFNRPAGNFDQQTEMDVRGGGRESLPRADALLVTGKLRLMRCAPIGEHHEETQRRKLRLMLFLNPTRFVRYQRRPANYLHDPPHLWRLGPANLRAPARPSRRMQQESGSNVEISLDGNDNVFIGSRALLFARPEAWPIHLRRYFEAIESTLHEEFSRAAIALGNGRRDESSFSRYPYYALKKVETYFEFSADNPIKVLRHLRPALELLGKRFRTRHYPVGRCELESDGDSPRIILHLGSGRDLRVYAKTTRRIRFEIMHDITKPGISRLLHSEGTGYTTESLAEVREWVRVLALDAAHKINDIFTILETQSEIPGDSADTYELLGAIFETVHGKGRAKQMVTLLVENGCLRIGPRGSEFQTQIQQLRRKGVLENIAGANVVTRHYRAALNKLRRQAGLPPLGRAR